MNINIKEALENNEIMYIGNEQRLLPARRQGQTTAYSFDDYVLTVNNADIFIEIKTNMENPSARSVLRVLDNDYDQISLTSYDGRLIRKAIKELD